MCGKGREGGGVGKVMVDMNDSAGVRGLGFKERVRRGKRPSHRSHKSRTHTIHPHAHNTHTTHHSTATHSTPPPTLHRHDP